MAVRGSGTAVTDDAAGDVPVVLGPLADETEEVRLGVEAVCAALMFTFYTGTQSPYLPADPAAVEGWARQLYGLGVRCDKELATEMPIVPAWLRVSAQQQFVEVTGQIDPAAGTIPDGVATVGEAPPLPAMYVVKNGQRLAGRITDAPKPKKAAPAPKKAAPKKRARR